MKKLTLFCTLTLLSWGYVAAQNMDQTKEYIRQLHTLPTSVNNVMASINATNFGPFHISGSCEYDYNFLLCGGTCYKWSWSWDFPNFQWLKGSLRQQYQNVLNTAAKFDKKFLPVKNWLLTTLPGFTNLYKNEMDKILAAEAVFKNPSSTPDEQLYAKQMIILSIRKINEGIQQGSDELRTGILNLSDFGKEMQIALNRIENLKGTMENSLNNNIKLVIEKTADFPCDRDKVRAQVINLQESIKTQFYNVLTQNSNFGIAAENIDKGTSIILGTLINIQNQYQGVLERLKNAQLTPEGAVQELRLNVTYLSWQDLVIFVGKEFS